MKTFFFALVRRVNNRTRGQGPYGYIGHKWGASGGPQNSAKITKKWLLKEINENLLSKYKTKGMTPYRAVDKNFGSYGGL